MTNQQSYDEQSRKDYLKGAFESNPLSKDSLEGARDSLERAVERSPSYGRAHGELAYTYVNIAVAGWHGDGEAEAAWGKAKTHAEKAVELAPDDYMSYWNLAHYLVNTGDEGDFDRGLATFEKALELFNTNTDPMDRKHGLLVEFGEALIYGGQVRRGIELIEKATRAPDWYYWTLAFGRYCDKDYGGAVDALEQMRNKPGDENFLFASLLIRGAAEAQRGNAAAAKQAVDLYVAQCASPAAAEHLVRQELDNNAFRGYRDTSKQDAGVKTLALHWIEGLEKAGFPGSGG